MSSRFVSALESGEYSADTKEVLRSDLKSVGAIDPNRIAALKASFEHLLPIRLKKDFDEELVKEACKVGIRESDFARAYRAMKSLVKYFHRSSQREVDDPTEVAQALVSLGYVDKAALAALEKFLTCVREIGSGIELQRDRAIRTGPPELIRIEAAIDFRTLFASELQFGDKSEGTNSKFSGLIPLISLKVVHDLENVPDYVLTCRPETLDRVIDLLTATRERLNGAESFVRQKATA